MKTIGLIGGMCWESSIEYYRIINEKVREVLGGHFSAKSVMVSVNFEEIKLHQYNGKWDAATDILVQSAQQLEQAGADFVMICTNTMHKMAEEVQASISIPLLHIADVTGDKIVQSEKKKVGLLATKFTMEQDFYKDRLREKFGIDVIIPDEADRDFIHHVIYQEIMMGELKPESKAEYKRIIDKLVMRGAEGIILGCTEIMLLIDQSDCSIPIFDTTQIHAEAGVEFALNK
ncbi:aspartate/glutamate racemase family protein [Brevibacillus sp. SYSU BS000544]|uniref:aspartate/glutamate racemase family protein n=1 Tax=Brevibacillus sp. SYSU BS000544 TaxID=3416443 RepID=UPI003CE57F84